MAHLCDLASSPGIRREGVSSLAELAKGTTLLSSLKKND